MPGLAAANIALFGSCPPVIEEISSKRFMTLPRQGRPVRPTSILQQCSQQLSRIGTSPTYISTIRRNWSQRIGFFDFSSGWLVLDTFDDILCAPYCLTVRRIFAAFLVLTQQFVHDCLVFR